MRFHLYCAVYLVGFFILVCELTLAGSGVQVIRRRYGTVSQASGLKLKYHEYNLVEREVATGKWSDAKDCTLFHLLPLEIGNKEGRQKKRTASSMEGAASGNGATPRDAKPNIGNSLSASANLEQRP